MILFSLLSVLGYALALSRAARWPAETALFATICSLMTYLFWAGFFGMLQIGASIALAGGLVALLAALRPATFAAPLYSSVTPGIVAFVALCVIHWLKLQDIYIAAWDEFSHWALQSKVISLTDALPGKEDPVVFKDYPPAAALFQYFGNLGSGFNEGNALAAHSAITLAAVVTTLQQFGWRNWLAALFILVIGYGLVYLLGQGFNSLLIDQALGAVFGATLVVYFLSPGGVRSRLLSALPGILVLPLMKAIGLQLALLAAVIISFGAMLDLTLMRRSRSSMDTDGRGRRLVVLLCFAALICAPFASKFGWDHFKRRIEAAETFKISPSIHQIMNSLSPSQSTERDRVTVAAFKRAFVAESATIVDELPLAQRFLDEFPLLQRLDLARTNPPQLPAITTLNWVALLAVLGVALSLAQADQRARRLAFYLQTCLALGFAFYALGHLIAYLYSFSEYEGTRVASFGRYMRSYLFGWALVNSALLALASLKGRFRRISLIATTVLAVLSFGFMPARGVQLLERPAAGMVPERAALQPQLGSVMARVGEKRKVYIIFQNTNGFEHWIAKYELAPRRTNLDCWSVGNSYGKEDAWTCDLSASELYSRLLGYDYLYLARADDAFWQRFSSLFKDTSSGGSFLFEVRKSDGGTGSLIPVAP